MKKILGEGKYLRLVKEDRWEYVERNNCTGIVSVVPITKDGKIILTEQYRMALKKWVIELPAGLANDTEKKETLEEAALRELEEETGYTAEKLILLFEGPPSAGMSSEIIHYYLAEGLKKVSEGGGDDTEQIRVHAVPRNEIDTWLKQKQKEGCLVDPKMFVGLYCLQNLSHPLP